MSLWPGRSSRCCCVTVDVVSLSGLRYTAHMKGVLGYLAIGFLVATAGCASTRVIPASLEAQVDNAVTFGHIVASPDPYRGKIVLLGGEVLRAKVMQGGTQLEILQLPLDDDQEPERDRLQSKGRFLALHKEFLDPATIVEGTRVTLVGEVTGASVEKMDEADYRFPMLDVKHLHRWDRKRDDQPRASGPWWGVFGGVGFGGGGSRSGGGISIGF
jgi:outer membrane lipoprotein